MHSHQSLVLYLSSITSTGPHSSSLHFFFFNDTATTEIYTLSLHDALPISHHPGHECATREKGTDHARVEHAAELRERDRKSTRLNSSHPSISYAVFCLKKKKKKQQEQPPHYTQTY